MGVRGPEIPSGRGSYAVIGASKYHAYGNDFLIVARGPATSEPRTELARAICDPHFGVGADGCVFVEAPSGVPGPVAFRIFNQDGSEAEMSGNGLRCAAAYLHHHELVPGDEIVFETAIGRRSLKRLEARYPVWSYRAAMGPARFSSEDVPMRLPSPRDRVIDYALQVGDLSVSVTALSVGNPQCVVFLEVPLGDRDFATLGRGLAGHSVFPEGTNVSFVRIIDRSRIRVRIWERGVGPTHSSGTGCSGAAVAALVRGVVANPVRVETETGTQLVEWRDGEEISLTGEASFIADLRFEWVGRR